MHKLTDYESRVGSAMAQDRTIGRRYSRMALLAPLVALAGFPLSPHWIFESELLAFSRALGLNHDGVGLAVMFLWPSTTTAFCVIAMFRVRGAQGRLRGFSFAFAGLAIQLLGVFATIAMISLFSFR